jgi:hypothetical protein
LTRLLAFGDEPFARQAHPDKRAPQARAAVSLGGGAFETIEAHKGTKEGPGSTAKNGPKPDPNVGAMAGAPCVPAQVSI